MGLTLITPPAAEPISTATAKLHLRVDHSSDDTLIDNLVKAARISAEHWTGRAVITQTWEKTLDQFPCGSYNEGIVLPFPPLASVASLKYIDQDGVLQTMSSSDYKVLANRTPGEVVLAYNKTWPTVRCEADAITVRYTAGYGVSGASVPDSILQAMLLMVGHWYEHRKEVSEVQMSEVPMSAQWLLGQKRVWALI